MKGLKRRSVRILILSILLFIDAGCSILFPRQSALNSIHETYRTEFIQYMVPPPAEDGKGLSRAITDDSAFVKTLREIRDFRVRYGKVAEEASHLKVLEAMIYLQTGRLGSASLLKSDIMSCAEQLRSKEQGYYTRDYLFAISFGHLVDGWQEVYNASDYDDKTVPEIENLEKAALGIEQSLRSLDPSKLAQPEVDQGGIYLATTAAIFYIWVYELRAEEGTINPKTDWFKKGRDLIGLFMSQEERKMAVSKEKLPNAATLSGRMRYLDWYGYLDSKSK